MFSQFAKIQKENQSFKSIFNLNRSGTCLYCVVVCIIISYTSCKHRSAVLNAEFEDNVQFNFNYFRCVAKVGRKKI